MTADENFSVTAGAGGSNPAVGATSFTVTITSRPHTYAVVAALQGVQSAFGIDIGSLTSTSFSVELTAPLASGDTIAFHVYDVANTTIPVPASNVVLLTSGSGTYTPTTGTTRVWLRMVGAGGGGGGTPSGASGNLAVGGGGSGGVYLDKWIDPSAAITGGSYTVGTGGAGGASTPTNGSSGNDTTIVIQGITYTAKGGHGGNDMTSGNTAFVSPAGTTTTGSGASSGTVDALSQQGGDGGIRMSGAGGGAIAGGGGSSVFGTGGGQLFVANTGNAGTGFGSGGGGSFSTTAGHAGGAGAGGCIVVYEFV